MRFPLPRSQPLPLAPRVAAQAPACPRCSGLLFPPSLDAFCGCHCGFPPVGSNLDSNVTRSTYQTDHDDRDLEPRLTSREFLLENAITDKLLDKTSDSKELVLNMTINSIFAQGDPINSVGSPIDSLYVDYEDTDGLMTYSVNSTYMELSNGKATNTSAETPFSNATVTMSSPQGNRTHKARQWKLCL